MIIIQLMEKAILKTLIYADIFDYPLTIFEIHKWLIGRKVSLRQVEKALGRLSQESRVKSQGGYYFLPKRDGLVVKRTRREKQSEKYLRKAQVLSSLLKLIPWVKLVGVSGGLAMENASKRDDIDLFIVTSKNRLWISRLLALGLLSLTGQRRKVGYFGRKIAGKLCINTLLEEDRLAQRNKDIYLAHEILQMKVLWQRDGIYSKYLLDNEWTFKFLPNWVSPDTSLRGALATKQSRLPRSQSSLAMTIVENIAKWFQLKIMRKPQGMERIEDGALYFHPNDIRPKVLSGYQRKLKRIINP
ncbi:hypothetical protein A3D79_03625 [Candidatus Daviesbacteria bacterium RIFCSPHIGHO2_02_FULL_39_8]|nr:MAG: hypothetical protein A3D79_03625 [Candidatus Daviesbacteria bacterium RIFCSPHIGHO2_02_FULL_39_8]